MVTQELRNASILLSDRPMSCFVLFPCLKAVPATTGGDCAPSNQYCPRFAHVFCFKNVILTGFICAKAAYG